MFSLSLSLCHRRFATETSSHRGREVTCNVQTVEPAGACRSVWYTRMCNILYMQWPTLRSVAMEAFDGVDNFGAGDLPLISHFPT